jgi:hypothetical protein
MHRFANKYELIRSNKHETRQGRNHITSPTVCREDRCDEKFHGYFDFSKLEHTATLDFCFNSVYTRAIGTVEHLIASALGITVVVVLLTQSLQRGSFCRKTDMPQHQTTDKLL